MIRLLFIGDVVGRSGRAAVLEQVPHLRARWGLDFVVVNGENAAGGFGLTESLFEEFLAAGVDAVTLGNHAFDQREALVFIERQPRLIRPVNFPPGTPGRGAAVVENAKGARLLVVNVMGRIFMDALDDPFAAVKRELAPLSARRKVRRLDRRLPRRGDERKMGVRPFRRRQGESDRGHAYPYPQRRLPHPDRGTGYISDVGMTGDYDSVIGMDKDEPLRRFTSKISSGRFEPALGPATLCAIAAEIGPDGRTKAIAPVRIGGLLSPAEPDFWT